MRDRAEREAYAQDASSPSQLVPPPQYYGPEEAELSIVALRLDEDAGPRSDANGLPSEGIAVNAMQVITRLALPRRGGHVVPGAG